MRIEDGSGGGSYAAVTSDNQLQTRAVQISALHDACLNGDAYAWNAISADIDATDTALLVRNDSSTRYLVIEKVYVYCDVATAIDVHVIPNSTFTAAGTAVTGVNLLAGSGKTADATALADETGNTQGSIIVTLHTAELTTAQMGIDYDFKGGVLHRLFPGHLT
jgi:hypothetical protein